MMSAMRPKATGSAGRSLALLLSAGLILGGCAEIELISHAKKVFTRDRAPTQVVTPSQTEMSGPRATALGRYKVGSPYQIKGKWYYPAVDYAYVETGVASWYGPGFHGKQTANGEIFDENALTAAHRTLPMPSMVKVTNLSNGRAIKLIVNDRGPFAHNRIIDVSKRGAELLGFKRDGIAKVRVEVLQNESRQLASLAQAKKPRPNMAIGSTGNLGGQGLLASVNPKPQEELAVPIEPVQAVSLTPLPLGSLSSTPIGEVKPLANENIQAAQTPVLREPIVEHVPVTQTEVFIQAGAFSQYHNANRLRARLSSLGAIKVTDTKTGGRTFYRVRLGPLQDVEEADRMLSLLHANGFNEAKIVLQ